jgi:hypothetical protein
VFNCPINRETTKVPVTTAHLLRSSQLIEASHLTHLNSMNISSTMNNSSSSSSKSGKLGELRRRLPSAASLLPRFVCVSISYVSMLCQQANSGSSSHLSLCVRTLEHKCHAAVCRTSLTAAVYTVSCCLHRLWYIAYQLLSTALCVCVSVCACMSSYYVYINRTLL